MEINEILNGLGGQKDNCNNSGFGGSWIWLILLFILFGSGCGGGFGAGAPGGYQGYAPVGDTYTCKCKCKKNKCCCGSMPMYQPYAAQQGAGCGFNSWWIIILLLFFCGGRGFGNNGCGCNDNNNVCV